MYPKNRQTIMKEAKYITVEEVAKVECNCPYCNIRQYLEYPILAIRYRIEEVCGSCGKVFEISEE